MANYTVMTGVSLARSSTLRRRMLARRSWSWRTWGSRELRRCPSRPLVLGYFPPPVRAVPPTGLRARGARRFPPCLRSRSSPLSTWRTKSHKGKRTRRHRLSERKHRSACLTCGGLFCSGQEEGEAEQFTEEDGTSGSSATAPGSAAPMGAPTAPPVPQNTAGQHPQHAFPMQAPGPPSQTVPFLGNHPNINPQMNMPPPPPFPPGPELQMLQNLLPFSAMGQNPVEFLSNLLRSQTMGQQGGQWSVGAVC